MVEPDYRGVVKDILVGMFNDILRVEHKAIESEDMLPLSMSELHVIEVVGDHQGTTIMSQIARKLRITLPTLTAAVDRLEEKGYILRRRSEEDRRRVSVELTEDGRQAYERHARFHEKMVDAFLQGLEQSRMPELLEGMTRLRDFFKEQVGQLEKRPAKILTEGK